MDSVLNISVLFSPTKENISLQEKIPEDTISTGISSENLLPPIQGKGGLESTSTCLSQQNLVQDNSEQICQLDIVMSWDNNDNFNETISLENLSGGEGLLNRCPKDQSVLTEEKLDDPVKVLETFEEVHEDKQEYKTDDNKNQNCDIENDKENRRNNKNDDSDYTELIPAEDVKPYSSSETLMPQVSGQECDVGQGLIKNQQKNEDVQAPEIVPMPTGQELAEDMGGEVIGNPNTCTANTCTGISEQQEEDEQTTSCLSVGQLFRWLRKRILLTLQRKQDPDEVTEGHKRHIQRRFFRRSYKIQPEEQLEN
ncbi:uncharacterized protein C12orf71 homolog [Octodon degus]|uniref:Uncharacterized protein C12orf71 homolog n=1 Tax=Octodon degus TaxID=10160 RepID=A0A6P3EJ95_OCTDE|nr:uncharacterized protein C12orf71 homolog [Octodon degus]